MRGFSNSGAGPDLSPEEIAEEQARREREEAAKQAAAEDDQ